MVRKDCTISLYGSERIQEAVDSVRDGGLVGVG